MSQKTTRKVGTDEKEKVRIFMILILDDDNYVIDQCNVKITRSRVRKKCRAIYQKKKS
jgi:hypothetical protein